MPNFRGLQDITPPKRRAVRELRYPERMRPPTLLGASTQRLSSVLLTGKIIETKPGTLPDNARARVVTNHSNGATVDYFFPWREYCLPGYLENIADGHTIRDGDIVRLRAPREPTRFRVHRTRVRHPKRPRDRRLYHELERRGGRCFILHDDILPSSITHHLPKETDATSIEEENTSFHADLRPAGTPHKTVFDKLPFYAEPIFDRENYNLAWSGASRMITAIKQRGTSPALERIRKLMNEKPSLRGDQRFRQIDLNKLTRESFFNLSEIIYAVFFVPIRDFNYSMDQRKLDALARKAYIGRAKRREGQSGKLGMVKRYLEHVKKSATHTDPLSRAMDETTPEHFVMVPLVDVLGGPYRTEDAFKTAARPIEDLLIVELGTLKPDGLNGRLEILRIAARRRRKRLSDSRV